MSFCRPSLSRRNMPLDQKPSADVSPTTWSACSSKTAPRWKTSNGAGAIPTLSPAYGHVTAFTLEPTASFGTRRTNAIMGASFNSSRLTRVLLGCGECVQLVGRSTPIGRTNQTTPKDTLRRGRAQPPRAHCGDARSLPAKRSGGRYDSTSRQGDHPARTRC